MANIGTLEGYMYLRNAWRIILANDINMNAELEAIKDRMQEYIFYVNPTQVSIDTTAQTLVKFDPEVISHTHMTIGFNLNINAAAATNINISIKFDGVTSNLIQSINVGWNIIAFPYIIPSVGTGIHSIEIIVSLDSGTAAIQPGRLNVFVQAQSILGYSSLPPALNVFGEIPYVSMSDDKIQEDAVLVLIDDVTIESMQEVNYSSINDNKVVGTVEIQLE